MEKTLISPNTRGNLNRFELRTGTSDRGDWAGIFISLKVGKKDYINFKPLFFPRPDDEDYEKRAERIGNEIDHVASMWIVQPRLAELLEESNNDLIAYASLVCDELKSLRYWKKDMYMKILPPHGEKGNIYLGSVPFISWKANLSYTDYEVGKVEEFLGHKPEDKFESLDETPRQARAEVDSGTKPSVSDEEFDDVAGGTADDLPF